MNTSSPTARWTPDAFVGGHSYLDFLNTGGGPAKARDAAPFEGWADVLDWLAMAGLLAANERRPLLRLANGSGARAALSRLATQRESAYAVLSAIAGDRTVPEAPRQQLENDIRLALRHATLSLVPHRQGAWLLDVAGAGLDLPRHRLALSAQSLIADGLLPRLHECEGCTWLFLDTSRGGRRRWCSMATCGNRAKARRHYQARQAAG
ncbi:CGNR zinc finger domain-containing protein [Bordetella sp. BOR01]|uniref:CGNR zinc finger domain-containing protein n=1 Tax=Bordetella sp. BOR01 TaxID=2854779 RepID=UPI00210597E7|nr:CGNR zinc finger domain-containing protein [Bordetella sp. BOR01]